ncbi:MAG TPA: hypothetical protein DEP84_30950 [Chloroflexi bacterium]|nr:hypothetical protein [Chloroflexota bacterium]
MVFDRDRLEQELSTLPLEHAIAFAASCCQRLLPNYDAFATIEHQGSPYLLRQALDEVWQYLKGAPFPESHIRELMEAIVVAPPDMDANHPSLFAPLAHNAAVAIHYALNCCLTKEQKWAAYSAAEAVDCVMNYLAGVNTVYFPQTEIHGPHLSNEKIFTYESLLDHWIKEEAPLMVVELEQQQWDLKRLRDHEILSSAFLDEIRLSSSATGIQPFPRGLAVGPNQELVNG